MAIFDWYNLWTAPNLFETYYTENTCTHSKFDNFININRFWCIGRSSRLTFFSIKNKLLVVQNVVFGKKFKFFWNHPLKSPTKNHRSALAILVHEKSEKTAWVPHLTTLSPLYAVYIQAMQCFAVKCFLSYRVRRRTDFLVVHSMVNLWTSVLRIQV